MGENIETDVDANSHELRRGVEAGINSEDKEYRQAGNEPDQAFSDRETKELVKEGVYADSDTPLFLMDTPDGQKGDAQDEKDESAE